MRPTLFIIIIVSLLLSSCKVQNLFVSDLVKGDNIEIANLELIKEFEYKLEPDDKISISVWGHDDLSVGSIYDIYNSNEVYGRWILIDKYGDAEVPKIGKMRLSGLTLVEAEKLISEKLSKYVKDPIVSVQVLNRTVTILGEVKSPGNYILEKEINTLVEIVGKAEGFDFYADKNKIKLIRGSMFEPKEYLIDLTQMDIYEQNNVLVQNGDIIYVPAKNTKAMDKRSSTIIPLTALISSAVLIITLVN